MSKEKIKSLTFETKSEPALSRYHTSTYQYIYSTWHRQFYAYTCTHTGTRSVAPTPLPIIISSGRMYLSISSILYSAIFTSTLPSISSRFLQFFNPFYLHPHTPSPGVWTVTFLHEQRRSWEHSAAGLLHLIDWPKTRFVSTLYWGERERGVCCRTEEGKSKAIILQPNVQASKYISIKREIHHKTIQHSSIHAMTCSPALRDTGSVIITNAAWSVGLCKGNSPPHHCRFSPC